MYPFKGLIETVSSCVTVLDGMMAEVTQIRLKRVTAASRTLLILDGFGVLVFRFITKG
jgi:predicted acyltransferase